MIRKRGKVSSQRRAIGLKCETPAVAARGLDSLLLTSFLALQVFWKVTVIIDCGIVRDLRNLVYGN